MTTVTTTLEPRDDELAISRSGWRWVLRQLARKRTAQVGGLVVLVILICTVAAPLIAPYDPLKIDAINRLLPPSAEHWFGTDELGRDLYSRIVFGAQYFVLIAVAATAIAASVGVLAGLVAGAGPYWADSVIMRIMDVLFAFPYILLVLAVIAILGPSLWTGIFAVGIAAIPGYARTVRSAVLSVKQEEYVEAMQALGASPGRIIFGTILPNVLSPIVIYTSYAMPLAVLLAAALSFLGLGTQPPIPEWGSMMVNARTFIRSAWWVVAVPGLALFVAILSLNLLGNALRDVLDPKGR